MKTRLSRPLVFAALLAGLSLLALGLAGCELDSAESAGQAELQITPDNSTVRKGQAVEFTASGWTDYTWSLSDHTWGTLSHRTGNRTVYTCIVSTGGVQVLTCSSTVSTTGSTQVVSAEALIVHK